MAIIVDQVNQLVLQAQKHVNDLPPEAQIAGTFVAGATVMYMVLEHDLVDKCLRQPLHWFKRQCDSCTWLRGHRRTTLSAAEVRANERISARKGRPKKRSKSRTRKRGSSKRR